MSFPDRAGITLPTALAAPVEEGMMFPEAARPPLQSFFGGAVHRLLAAGDGVDGGHQAFLMPKASWRTLATGARQLVVQEALETKSMLLS